MIVLYWNIRGLANKYSRDVLFDHIKQLSPDVVCLAEPMMNVLDFPIALLHLFNMKLYAYNIRDGVSKIWILVKKNINNPNVVSNTDQEISIDFLLGNKSFRISFVYANVHIYARRRLWHLLQSLAPSDSPWLLIGDFNAILGAHERRGGNLPNSTSCHDFSKMIDDIELHEITMKGAPFTWARKSARGYMECKLDRALCNSAWLEHWNWLNCFSRPRHASDHNPIVLQFLENSTRGPVPFRFKSMWLEHENFEHFVKEKWCSYSSSGSTIGALISKL